ncbi:hypothetical protein A3727_05155 [Erythrobacter sp. HI0038]|nr:hypothetical protein A3719_02175 [Erythrobacter sp. HI0020]KZY17701.1 hypothetical protein A3727_05155 [Erythrobacter sp. HI0038]
MNRILECLDFFAAIEILPHGSGGIENKNYVDIVEVLCRFAYCFDSESVFPDHREQCRIERCAGLHANYASLRLRRFDI